MRRSHSDNKMAAKSIMLFALAAQSVLAVTEMLPFKCETTGGSPLQSDCVQLARDYICVENRCHHGTPANHNPSGSHCSTLWKRGTCAVALCGSEGSLQQGEVGAAIFGILSSCTNGNRVGGATDMLGFGQPKITVELINTGVNHRRELVEGTRNIAARHASDNVTKRDLVNGAQQYKVPGTGYTLEVVGRRNDGERITDQEAQNLNNAFVNDMGQRPWNARTVHGGVQAGWDGFADMTYYVNPVDNYLGDFAPNEPRMIAQAVQDFRNNLGNPGWFAVALYSSTALLGVLNFQIADFA
jgi:hypothetical protein